MQVKILSIIPEFFRESVSSIIVQVFKASSYQFCITFAQIFKQTKEWR